MAVVQNAGSIGIKLERYTIEWMQAIEERERIENTNPVSRYLIGMMCIELDGAVN